MDNETLLLAAAGRLGQALDGHVALDLDAALSTENTVLRCRVTPALPDGVASVIVKRVTSTAFNRPGGSAESQRFLNEWVCLEFLDTLPGPGRFGPRLLAADRSDSFLVLEDLGPHPTVEQVLLGDDRAGAMQALTGIGRTLGGLQRATRGLHDRFSSAQQLLGTASPTSDSTIDVRLWADLLTECCDALGIEPAAGFWAEVERVEGEIHRPGPFTSFIHADAGPHNYLRLATDLRLLDFEFGAVRHGLSDVVSARLGFPQTTRSHAVPVAAAEALETAWRAEISEDVPEAEDDALFARSLTAAAAHWALVAWGGLWRRHVRLPGDDGAEAAEHARGRANAHTLHRGFITLSGETGHYGAIAATVERYLEALEMMWPGLEPRPVYPALAPARS